MHSVCILSMSLSTSTNLENSAVATELEKVSFHSNPKKGNVKEFSNYHTIVPISHASKVMLKILQARPKQYVNHELPDIQAGFRKDRGTEIKLPTFTGSSKKQERSRKTSIFSLLTVPKPLPVENSERDGNTRPPDLPLEKPTCRSGSNS